MKCLSLIVALSLVLGSSAVARGDASEPRAYRSPWLGFSLGAGATIATLWLASTVEASDDDRTTAARVLGLTGLVVGPSVGLFYGRRTTAATAGIIGRALLVGGVLALTPPPRPGLDIPHIDPLTVALATGALVWAAVDVLRTPIVIDRDNRRAANNARLVVLPAAFARGAVGVVANGTF